MDAHISRQPLEFLLFSPFAVVIAYVPYVLSLFMVVQISTQWRASTRS